MTPTTKAIGGTTLAGGLVALVASLYTPSTVKPPAASDIPTVGAALVAPPAPIPTPTPKPPAAALEAQPAVVVAAAHVAPAATALTAELASLKDQVARLNAAAMGPPAPIVVQAPPGPDLSKQMSAGFQAIIDGMIQQTKVIIEAQPKPAPPAPDLSKQLADGINAIMDRFDRAQAAQAKPAPHVQELPAAPIAQRPPAQAPPSAVAIPAAPTKSIAQLWTEAMSTAADLNLTLVLWIAKPPCIDKPPAGTLFFYCEKFNANGALIETPTVWVCRAAGDATGRYIVTTARLNDPQCGEVMQAIQAAIRPAPQQVAPAPYQPPAPQYQVPQAVPYSPPSVGGPLVPQQIVAPPRGQQQQRPGYAAPG